MASVQGADKATNQTYRAAGDLSAKQYYAVKLSTSNDEDVAIAGAGEVAIGILSNTPIDNELADVTVFGTTKAKVGASVTRGNFLKVTTDGSLIPVASDKDYYVARALTGAAIGDIIPVLVAPGYYAA